MAAKRRRVLAAAWVALGAAALAAAWSGPAAGQQRRPVFRAGSAYVSVDVYPRRDGRFVDDLTAADFTVLEDGEPQAIESFEVVRVSPVTSEADRRDPVSKAHGDELAGDPRARVFVVFLDSYNVSPEGARRLRPPLLEFLARAIGPSDLFGLLTVDEPVDRLVFGRRLEVVDDILARTWVWARDRTERLTPREQFLTVCYMSRTEDPKLNERIVARLLERWRLDRVFEGLENLVVWLRALRDERSTVVLASGGWVPGPRDAWLQQFAWRSVPELGVGPRGRLGAGSQQPGRPDRTACDQELLHLASIDFEERFRHLVRDAGASNVAFVGVDPELRVRTGLPAGVPAFDETPQGFLRRLTADTGGRDIVLDPDLGRGLRAVADDVSAFYLLGYYSTNPKLDGRFRRIEVKVARPGVRVTARRGYLAPTPDSLGPPPGAVAPPPPSPEAEALVALARLHPNAELYASAAALPGALAVAVELPASRASDPAWRGGATVSVLVADAAGDPAGAARGRIDAGAASVELTVPVTGPPPWRVDVRAEAGRERVDARTEARAPAGTILGEPRLSRVTGGRPPQPVAAALFQRADRARLAWRAAGPLDAREARLLGADGRPLAVPVTLAGGDAGELTAEVVLAPLAPGDYLVEITVSRGGTTERQLTGFRVAR